MTKEGHAKEADEECWWRKTVFPGIRRKARNKVVREKKKPDPKECSQRGC